ncbi:hypothetical protein H2248_010340 [Termitomyces sp. 'cryptogamus']|nr:hypothetical protein H2248_010340 [Termitomyces sp. 'cryptogamus']
MDQEIEKEAKETVNKTVKEAEAASEPPKEDLWRDIHRHGEAAGRGERGEVHYYERSKSLRHR